MSQWTTKDLAYLEEHAAEGALAVAIALNRSVSSVKHQASRYGISLRRRWLCRRCGCVTFSAPSPKTGWCVSCTREAQADEIASQIHLMEAERERELRATRRRQALYSKKNRRKDR